MYSSLRCCALVLVLFFRATAFLTAAPPYPKSPVIGGVVFNWSTHTRMASGSDNWAITWADDDHQYASWGDGGGFGGTNSDGRVSLGFARIEGNRKNYTGYNVWGGKKPKQPARFDGKSYGVLCVDGILYKWVGPGSGTTSYTESRLCKSSNHGAMWTRASWAYTKTQGLIMPTILNFGRNYAGARDDYVYHYFIRLEGNPSKLNVHVPGRIDLARVSKTKLMDQNAYEFFAGNDGDNSPEWTSDPDARRPVFENPAGVGWCLSVSYNPGLKRYLLCTEHTASFEGHLGMFDAPEPWGPWTTVFYAQDAELFGTGRIETGTFFWNFSNKWLSPDGRDFVLIFTGINTNDAWNTVEGSFGLASIRGPASRPPSWEAEQR